MRDYDDESLSMGYVERGGKKYRVTFSCGNKERAEREVKDLKRDGVPAIIVPCRSYHVYRLIGAQRK
jgi:hypothetical protein